MACCRALVLQPLRHVEPLWQCEFCWLRRTHLWQLFRRRAVDERWKESFVLGVVEAIASDALSMPEIALAATCCVSAVRLA